MNGINIPMTPGDHEKYFSCSGKGVNRKLSVIDIGRLTVLSGRLTALDYYAFYGFFGMPCYTEDIPEGEYNVKASVADYGSGGYRVAAVKVCFTEDEPVDFKMALREGEDVSKLGEGFFYGFDVDGGLACIADPAVMNEYLDFQESFEEDCDEDYDCDRNFYEDHLEPMFQRGYEKYPELEVDFIDYTVPETDHHMVIVHSGLGDGTYPVYFGYSGTGKLCCAVVQFIFTDNL